MRIVLAVTPNTDILVSYAYFWRFDDVTDPDDVGFCAWRYGFDDWKDGATSHETCRFWCEITSVSFSACRACVSTILSWLGSRTMSLATDWNSASLRAGDGSGSFSNTSRCSEGVGVAWFSSIRLESQYSWLSLQQRCLQHLKKVFNATAAKNPIEKPIKNEIMSILEIVHMYVCRNRSLVIGRGFTEG